MQIGVAVAFGIIIAVSIGGSTSPAHFNPSITIAHTIYRGFPLRKVPLYVSDSSAPKFHFWLTNMQLSLYPRSWRVHSVHPRLLPKSLPYPPNGRYITQPRRIGPNPVYHCGPKWRFCLLPSSRTDIRIRLLERIYGCETFLLIEKSNVPLLTYAPIRASSHVRHTGR